MLGIKKLENSKYQQVKSLSKRVLVDLGIFAAEESNLIAKWKQNAKRDETTVQIAEKHLKKSSNNSSKVSKEKVVVNLEEKTTPTNLEGKDVPLVGEAASSSLIKPVQSSGHEVFLSYQSAYTEIVEKLREELIKSKISCWMA